MSKITIEIDEKDFKVLEEALKSVKIIKEELPFIVDTKDLPGRYTWDEANKMTSLLNTAKYNGANTWRLPTKEELNILYLNKNVIGGFSTLYYWSSTEYDATGAWRQNFGSGSQFNDYKYGIYYVRLIRNN